MKHSTFIMRSCAAIILFVAVVAPFIMTMLFAYLPRHIKDTVNPLDEKWVNSTSPHELGIGVEAIKLETRDGAHIQTYFMKNETATQGVILVHGHADAAFATRDDLSRLLAYKAMVPLLKAGFSVLALDLRNHGNSTYIPPVAAGLKEYLDVVAAYEYLSDIYGPSSVGAYGESLGASTVLLAACDIGSLPAIVLDSPLANFEKLANSYANSFMQRYLPMHIPIPQSFTDIGLWWFSIITGLSFNDPEFNLETCAGRIPSAVFHAHGRKDDVVGFSQSGMLKYQFENRTRLSASVEKSASSEAEEREQGKKDRGAHSEPHYEFMGHDLGHVEALLAEQSPDFTSRYISFFRTFLK